MEQEEEEDEEENKKVFSSINEIRMMVYFYLRTGERKAVVGSGPKWALALGNIFYSYIN